MPMTLNKSWHTALKHELEKSYIQDLKKFLIDEEAQGYTIYPPAEKVFNAFSLTPFESVKVVIMGQDPYHGKGQAEGLCFSVAKGMKIPPSLQNIYKEIKSDVGVTPPDHGSLENWAKQGVLLLNATLTVRAGLPASHYGKGWEQFTDAVIHKLAERDDPIIFVLWGKFAKEKCERIIIHRTPPHIVLMSAHPSPYSAHNFLGCRHFSKINQALQNLGKTPINWV